MTKTFTGWHMAGIMIAFFGVIIAVNVTMATYAVSTFGGKVVENSYVAGQRFNSWLREARAQDALGWTASVEREADGRLSVRVLAGAAPLAGARVAAVASHPVGRAEDVTLRFSPAGGDGRFVSDRTLPAGRWYVHITVESGGETMRRIESVR
jgi:nitrogen fixation protein FixH